jgi:hypothetical protein
MLILQILELRWLHRKKGPTVVYRVQIIYPVQMKNGLFFILCLMEMSAHSLEIVLPKCTRLDHQVYHSVSRMNPPNEMDQLTHIISYFHWQRLTPIAVCSPLHERDCSRPRFTQVLFGFNTTFGKDGVRAGDYGRGWDGRRVKRIVVVIYIMRKVRQCNGRRDEPTKYERNREFFADGKKVFCIVTQLLTKSTEFP